MADLSGAIQANPQLFIDIVGGQRVTQYLCIAGLTVWFWDVCLTFDEEVALVWQRSRSIINFLYLLVSNYFNAFYLLTFKL